MNEEISDSGWFRNVDPGNMDAARDAIETGSSEEPANWPAQAVDAGFAKDEHEYYSHLHDATMNAARKVVQEQERTDDQQLKHAIRALDDCRRTSNELTERLVEWAGTHDADAQVDVEYVRELAGRDPTDPIEERLVSLAARIADLDAEAAELERFVERSAPDVAPNLAALAGPELAARLLSLAGGLETLARKPSGTLQVLGAEDALFAHLRGGAPSPKHGIIYTHEYVRGTRPEERGSAARALAGKLAIAARVDHYSGEYRPELERDLDERIERVRARGES